MSPMQGLKNRIALVTGGGRGIGAAIAVALARAGADVAVNYRERADAANAVCSTISGLGLDRTMNEFSFPCTFTDSRAIQAIQ
jgi:NAD(P)-dependent dehydrogenase (short-subunit alcohol dehydrogenase family)